MPLVMVLQIPEDKSGATCKTQFVAQPGQERTTWLLAKVIPNDGGTGGPLTVKLEE